MRIATLGAGAAGIVVGLFLAITDAKITHQFLQFIMVTAESPILVVGGSITMRSYAGQDWTANGNDYVSNWAIKSIETSGAYFDKKPLSNHKLGANWKVTLFTLPYHLKSDKPDTPAKTGNVVIAPFNGNAVKITSSAKFIAHKKNSAMYGMGMKFFDPACKVDPTTDDCDQILDTILIHLDDGSADQTYDCDGGHCRVIFSTK